MRTPSLVVRLALVQLAAAGLLLLAFAVSTVVLTQRTLEAQEGEALANTTTDLSAALQREWKERHDLRDAAQEVLKEDAPAGFEFEILDALGHPVLRSPAVSAHHPDGEVRSLRRHVPEGAWVVVSLSTRPRRTAVRALAFTLILVGIPLFVVTAALSRVAASRMLRPLRRMAAQSRRASEKGVVEPLGNANDPIELQQLGSAFNLLLARLERSLEGERRFTQDAAHELRTPLTVITGELEYALKRLPDSDPSRAGLEHAAEQAEGMSNLVEALMFLRRAESDSLSGDDRDTPINLTDVTRDAMDRLLDQEPARRGDTQFAGDDEVLVSGNGVLVAAAVRNLVSNALKFTSPGIRVRLTSRTRDMVGSVLVEDGGKGVRVEDSDRVFDPYFRDAEARASQSGFGIGLALARRIIRAHGGDVVLGQSDLGGARFELTLPIWQAKGGSEAVDSRL